MPARSLPPDPNLEHLKGQAKALRDASACTLAEAQFALARQYGFASWNRLRRHVGVSIRPVTSREELAQVFEVLGRQFPEPIVSGDRRFADLVRRVDEDRTLMLVAVDGDSVVGGALAFRHPDSSWYATVTLRIIALDAAYRGVGLGRRLMTAVEGEAVRLGAAKVALGVGGGDAGAKGFYQRLGYTGKSMMQKQLPLRMRRVERTTNLP